MQAYFMSESMCKPANKAKKKSYTHLCSVKCAQLVEV